MAMAKGNKAGQKGFKHPAMGALYDDNPQVIRCRFARLLIATVGS